MYKAEFIFFLQTKKLYEHVNNSLNVRFPSCWSCPWTLQKCVWTMWYLFINSTWCSSMCVEWYFLWIIIMIIITNKTNDIPAPFGVCGMISDQISALEPARWDVEDSRCCIEWNPKIKEMRFLWLRLSPWQPIMCQTITCSDGSHKKKKKRKHIFSEYMIKYMTHVVSMWSRQI